ncbi:ArsR/SmtB family transcription factor [Catellatospora bangladeshensis]|uniref:Transcriptional regulator n=1 Tax=Catellatospora bangladeshensis TaxID=310355 RepID=A0A8J3JJW7_9ACTN|nr:metalloregulator ArsR/SmtB family transcription factor [Catellatospora bangladeshensis]GIF86192.1 transcriptional regulator [Catellatospora bangladeshensis]
MTVVGAFAVLGEANRLRILELLRGAELSVGELVDRLGMSQPAVSKHLKVLREAGFVSSRIAAQQRFYRIEPEPFAEVELWLAPYRRIWDRHLDALERHLDDME